ncbi:interleukin-21 [Cheilinus undulatus]|uniref:interleukin-21 n=1 Tax=Cheilinus undulatus TaxID=241271 RepID=UPI001BD6B4A8|nr:interleukin-21 [Cheilinus undulatus]
MKLIAFCLLAVCCYSLANTETNGAGRSIKSIKLQEVLNFLKETRENLQPSEQLLNTPPQDIEDCCCLPALECFRKNLLEQLSGAEGERRKLLKSLRHPLTASGLNFCTSANNQTTCQSCDSHPKQNVATFFNRMETLIQSAITRLNMNGE